MPPQQQPILQGISTELRLLIFESLFERSLKTWRLARFSIFNHAYEVLSSYSPERRPDNYLGILRTCKQFHDEAGAVLYHNRIFLVCIMGLKVPHMLYTPNPRPTGRPETMQMWRFVRDLTLDPLLEPGRGNKAVVLERAVRFPRAIEFGRYLKRFHVVFTGAEDEALPGWVNEVAELLKSLRVKGEVDVSIDGGDEEQEGYESMCKELEMVFKVD
ncbi:hypothetical protein LTR37_009570 [Vermiconidia calcicola]|uniref:Uncharacterized protein n=1 Tax=Vermiconidia calcicola TaxID=1690605 RepID=A0ACC3N8R9_9PEZI|nr:hypothetical protein LTR37_009570 [Vermiconidia calcicola]